MLAQYLSRDWTLVVKHNELIKQVKYSPPPSKDTKFTPAIPCSQNPGVNPDGNARRTELNPFVDDALTSEIRKYIPVVIAASVDSLYTILGPVDEAIRRSPLCLKFFFKRSCSYERDQLG